MCHTLADFGRNESTGPTTSGITSPARLTITVSPTRTSLRCTSPLVVKRCSAHGHATNEYRVQHRIWRHRTRPADADADVVETGGLLLRRKLVGNRPPRALRREAERVLIGERIHLDDHAVDLVIRGVASLEGIVDIRSDTSNVEQLRTCRIDPEAQVGQPLHGLPMAGKARATFDVANLICPHRQLARSGHRGVLLPHRSRRGVTRVHIWLLSGGFLADVQLPERGERHVYLASNFEQRRRASLQAKRYRPDRSRIGRDVLSRRTVTPCRCPGQDAVAVAQGHGQTVDLELAGVGSRRPLERTCDSLLPRLELREGFYVVEREHAAQMGDRSQRVGDGASDALAW